MYVNRRLYYAAWRTRTHRAGVTRVLFLVSTIQPTHPPTQPLTRAHSICVLACCSPRPTDSQNRHKHTPTLAVSAWKILDKTWSERSPKTTLQPPTSKNYWQQSWKQKWGWKLVAKSAAAWLGRLVSPGSAMIETVWRVCGVVRCVRVRTWLWPDPRAVCVHSNVWMGKP